MPDGLKIPDKGFFSFDLKDTLRLVVWIIVTTLAGATVWNENAKNVASLSQTQAYLQSQIDTRTKENESAIANTARRLNQFDADLARKRETDAAIAVGLESIHTELRYMNEKIDVLRQEVAASRPKQPSR